MSEDKAEYSVKKGKYMKPKSRLGKADSIFASTTRKPETSKKEAAEPVPVRSSIEDKMTVIMPPDLVDYLDRLCLEIRIKSKWKARRTELIRAFVAGVQASGIDLIDCGSEEEIAARIQSLLK